MKGGPAHERFPKRDGPTHVYISLSSLKDLENAIELVYNNNVSVVAKDKIEEAEKRREK